ncbi:MAG: M48 family metallopeptidase [Paludibacteraceae bacterium]
MIKDKELGNITFERSLRARQILIKILPDELKIILPKGSTENDGVQFLESVREKLIQRQSKIQHKKILITDTDPLRTLTFTVRVQKAERKDIYSTLKQGELQIQYPDFLDCNTQQTQHYFWNSINYFLRNEAKRILPQRVTELARPFGFRFTDVKIQSSKTRWGSCNSKRNINLSFYLLLLPQELIDYVILHELCHTVELNHGEKFWRLMDLVTDNKSKILREKMKSYSMPK